MDSEPTACAWLVYGLAAILTPGCDPFMRRSRASPRFTSCPTARDLRALWTSLRHIILMSRRVCVRGPPTRNGRVSCNSPTEGAAIRQAWLSLSSGVLRKAIEPCGVSSSTCPAVLICASWKGQASGAHNSAEMRPRRTQWLRNGKQRFGKVGGDERRPGTTERRPDNPRRRGCSAHRAEGGQGRARTNRARQGACLRTAPRRPMMETASASLHNCSY
jgi:hypothetical protein